MSTQEITPIPFSVSEIARLFGLSEKTIRRAIKARELPVMLIQGRYRIFFHDALSWSSSRPRLRYSRDTAGIGQYVARWLVEQSEQPEPALQQQKGQLKLLD